MRHALGNAVFFGMIGVTFFGLFLTPVFYFSIRWITTRIFHGKMHLRAGHHHVETTPPPPQPASH
jgi:multidrug efflux pump